MSEEIVGTFQTNENYNPETGDYKCFYCGRTNHMSEWTAVQDAQVTMTPVWEDDHFTLDFDDGEVSPLDNIEIGCPECDEYEEIPTTLWNAAFMSEKEREEQRRYMEELRKRWGSKKRSKS